MGLNVKWINVKSNNDHSVQNDESLRGHCPNERRVRKRDKKVRRDKRCDLRRQRKIEGGATVTCDRRLFHRRAAATGNTEYSVHPESLMRQNVVVVWIQCLLVDVVRHTSILWRQNSDVAGDALRNLQPVKSAKQRADVVEPQRREYRPSVRSSVTFRYPGTVIPSDGTAWPRSGVASCGKNVYQQFYQTFYRCHQNSSSGVQRNILHKCVFYRVKSSEGSVIFFTYCWQLWNWFN